MATILVAHGAWSAGWAWRKMHPLLGAAGHRLLTPSYTGQGEREHLAHAGMGIERDFVSREPDFEGLDASAPTTSAVAHCADPSHSCPFRMNAWRGPQCPPEAEPTEESGVSAMT